MGGDRGCGCVYYDAAVAAQNAEKQAGPTQAGQNISEKLPSLPSLPSPWTQFTTKDGLGDDDIYAVACDYLGRTWVGHLNHGVSVYNGQKWQNYSVIADAQTHTVAGPLGARVFAIAASPVDGDMWIATDAGLTRYRQKSERWSYYTRAEGLPADQANSLAFDQEGTLYLGTQCEGLGIASAKDDSADDVPPLPSPAQPPAKRNWRPRAPMLTSVPPNRPA